MSWLSNWFHYLENPTTADKALQAIKDAAAKAGIHSDLANPITFGLIGTLLNNAPAEVLKQIETSGFNVQTILAIVEALAQSFAAANPAAAFIVNMVITVVNLILNPPSPTPTPVPVPTPTPVK